MAEPAALRVVITGRVQGVMFRDFTKRQAEALGLQGYVRNLPGGRELEVVAEGERGKLEELLAILKRGPSRALVEDISPVWSEYSDKYSDFRIRF